MNTQGIGDGRVYWANIDLSNVQYADFSKVQYFEPQDSEEEDAYDDEDQGKTSWCHPTLPSACRINERLSTDALPPLHR